MAEVELEIVVDLDGERLNKEENVRTLWCMMANARRRMRESLPIAEEGRLAPQTNVEAFIYNAGALGAYVDVLGLLAPPELAPDGSETDKP